MRILISNLEFPIFILFVLMSCFECIEKVSQDSLGPQTGLFARAQILHMALPPCTWHTCFNKSRCRKEDIAAGSIPVFIYDSKVDQKQGNLIMLPEGNLTRITKNADEACVFLYRVQISRRGFMEHPDRYWHSDGENHILQVIEGSGDSTLVEWAKGPSHNDLLLDQAKLQSRLWRSLGRAMVFSNNWVRQEFRERFDVSVPLFRELKQGWPLELASVQSQQKRFFLTFRGSIYSTRGRYRQTLLHLHNAEDRVSICGLCSGGRTCPTPPGVVHDCSRTYEELFNSTFCLVPGGYHPATFRLREAMSVGCIPVLVGDDYVKPFEDLIDWRNTAFEFCESCADDILPALKATPPEVVEIMRKNTLKYYEEYLSTRQAIWQTAFTVLLNRLKFRGL